MLEWIISSSLLILIVTALRAVLKRKISLRLRYALWALVLVRLLVPISFGGTLLSVENLTQQAAKIPETQTISNAVQTEIPRTTYEAAYEEVSDEYEKQGINIEEIPAEEYEQTIAPEIEEKMSFDISISDILMLVWLTGTAVVGVTFLVSNLRLYSKLRRTRTPLEVENCKLPVFISDEIETPCLFGLFRPAIYVTTEAAENPTTLRHTVEHETTHFNHRDNIWSLLRGVCIALHWYNPLVWWAAVQSRNDSELACDEATISRLGESERATYGYTLISLTCEKRPALLITATTMTGSGKSIKERISLIAKKPKMAVYTLIAVLLIALVAVGVTFTGASGSAEERIGNFIKTLYTFPMTEAQIEILTVMPEDMANGVDAAAEYQKTLDAVLDSNDFTEDFYNKLPQTILGNMVFPSFCAMNGYTIEPTEVTVEPLSEEDNSYSYTAELIVKRDGEEQTVTETGRVQTDDNGKISWIDPTAGSAVNEVLLGHSSWLPDIAVEDIYRITVEGTGHPLPYYNDEKIAVVLEYFERFPYETMESAEPPEDAVSTTIRMKDDTEFKFYFDEYGVYIDGVAYKSSELYLGMLAAQASPPRKWQDDEQPSLETRQLSEYLEPIADEVEAVTAREESGYSERIEDAECVDVLLDYIGEFPYYYRLPSPDGSGRSTGPTPAFILDVPDAKYQWMPSTDIQMHFGDTWIMLNEIYYFGPTYFDNVFSEIIRSSLVDFSNVELASMKLEDIIERSDLIVRGTYIDETEKERYATAAGISLTYAEFEVTEVYKGSCDDTITFFYCGGASPQSEILRERQEAGEEVGDPDDPQIRHRVRLAHGNLLAYPQEGGEYLMFLTETEFGYFASIKYHIREIDEEGLVYDPNTMEFEEMDFGMLNE